MEFSRSPSGNENAMGLEKLGFSNLWNSTERNRVFVSPVMVLEVFPWGV
jgi:hypothetical protein